MPRDLMRSQSQLLMSLHKSQFAIISSYSILRVSLRSDTVTKAYLDGSPLHASGLGDIDDGHAGLGESGAVVLQPEHVGGLAALGRVRVLRGLFEYGRFKLEKAGKIKFEKKMGTFLARLVVFLTALGDLVALATAFLGEAFFTALAIVDWVESWLVEVPEGGLR